MRAQPANSRLRIRVASAAFLFCSMAMSFASGAQSDDGLAGEAGAGAEAGAEAAANPSTSTASEADAVAEAPGAPPAAAPKTANEAYDLKVRAIEGKINDLKEQIWRAKAKLTLLTETVTGGLGSGASVAIVHQNDMGSAFVLREVHYFLDGAAIWQDSDETGLRLTDLRDKTVMTGNIVEGSHTLTVSMVYQGNGSGLFSYLDGYVFRVSDSFTFTAESGKVVKIRAVGYERGNFTTELTERPAIRFDADIEVDQRGGRRDDK